MQVGGTIAVIGAITGGVFFAGAMLFVKEYILDEPEDVDSGVMVIAGGLGAGLGAAVGTLIGSLVPGWSPVWP